MSSEWPITHFGLDAATMDSTARSVLTGDKRATTSLFASYAFDGEPLPFVGQRSIVRDSRDQDIAIIEVTRIERRRYCDVDAAFAQIEGAGDKSLAYWQKVHWAYLGEECTRCGIGLDREIEVVLEYFKVVKPLNTTD